MEEAASQTAGNSLRQDEASKWRNTAGERARVPRVPLRFASDPHPQPAASTPLGSGPARTRCRRRMGQTRNADSHGRSGCNAVWCWRSQGPLRPKGLLTRQRAHRAPQSFIRRVPRIESFGIPLSRYTPQWRFPCSSPKLVMSRLPFPNIHSCEVNSWFRKKSS